MRRKRPSLIITRDLWLHTFNFPREELVCTAAPTELPIVFDIASSMLRLAYRSPVRLVSAARLQTRRCTPLTLSKYSTTQHHKTPRNGRPFNESSERASGDSDSSGDIGRRGVGTYLSGALFLLSADALYTLWSEKQRDGNLDAAFTPHAIPDVPGFVARPDLTQQIRNIFRRRTGMYDVVVGNRGSGKSAILEKLAAETEGALYVCIADCEDVNRALTKALRKALGGELRPTLLVGTLWQKSLDSGLCSISAILGRPTNSYIGSEVIALQSALDEFERAAALFKNKHNRAAVLVIDNIDVIARKKPRLLGSIQNMAKFAADNHLYKVVFVCTSEATYHKLKGKLRSIQPFE
jgi:hypothetical protein